MRSLRDFCGVPSRDRPDVTKLGRPSNAALLAFESAVEALATQPDPIRRSDDVADLGSVAVTEVGPPGGLSR
jgi:hypothetical protein